MMPAIDKVMARPSASAQIFRVIAARKAPTTIFDLAQALGRPPESLTPLVGLMVRRRYLNRLGRLSPTEGRRGRTMYTIGTSYPKQLRSSAARAAQARAAFVSRMGVGQDNRRLKKHAPGCAESMPGWMSPRSDSLRSMVAAGSEYVVRTVRAHEPVRFAVPQVNAAHGSASCLHEHQVLLHTHGSEFGGLASAGWNFPYLRD